MAMRQMESELALVRTEICPGLVCPRCSTPLERRDGLLSGTAVQRYELICRRCYTTIVGLEFEER